MDGKFYSTMIVATYSMGETIETVAEITANHKGYFEYRVCPINDDSIPATRDCFNQYLLKDESGKTELFFGSGDNRNYTNYVKLPPGLTCNYCVLQWRYHAGNGFFKYQ